MEHSECKPGMMVRYFPERGGPGFTGIVAYEPWQLGHGTWVTKLIQMEAGYAQFTHKKGDKAATVFAANLEAMELTEQNEEQPHV